MNTKLASIIGSVWMILSISTLCLAQEWTLEVVESDLSYPWGNVGDFDNDGDTDFLFMDGESLIWYENLLPGWSRQTIDPSFPDAASGSFDVFDMDQDGDLDFTINGFANPGTMAWYENAMEGTQWTRRVMSATLNMPGNRWSAFGDLDGDGDIDISTPTYGDSRVLWLENAQGDTVWTEHEIDEVYRATWSTVGDLDGDSDLDIIAGSWWRTSIEWYENQLPDTIWPSSTVASLMGTAGGLCADIDGDSDLDFVTCSNSLNQLKWYENPTWIPHDVAQGREIWLGNAGDVDLDSDLDVTYGGNGFIGWSENLGSGASWQEHSIDTSTVYLNPMGLADIDLDSYPDVLASQGDFSTSIGDVRWYANPAPPTGIQGGSPSGYGVPRAVGLYQNVPNPFNPSTTISFDLPGAVGDREPVRLAIYNLRGRRIRTLIEASLEPGRHHVLWDGRDETGMNVGTGIYLYTLEVEKNRLTRKMTILK